MEIRRLHKRRLQSESSFAIDEFTAQICFLDDIKEKVNPFGVSLSRQCVSSEQSSQDIKKSFLALRKSYKSFTGFIGCRNDFFRVYLS